MSPLTRGIIAALVMAGGTMILPVTETFQPFALFVALVALVAFAAAWTEFSMLVLAGVALLFLLFGNAPMEKFGICLCGFGVAIALGLVVRLLARLLDRPAASSAG